jgi:hypothetical protein
MGDSFMAYEIYERKLEHEALGDPSIRAIADQLRKHPLLENSINLVVIEEDFKSIFKCVTEKMASSPSG